MTGVGEGNFRVKQQDEMDALLYPPIPCLRRILSTLTYKFSGGRGVLPPGHDGDQPVERAAQFGIVLSCRASPTHGMISGWKRSPHWQEDT